jgi:hypothetical protein
MEVRNFLTLATDLIALPFWEGFLVCTVLVRDGYQNSPPLNLSLLERL